MTRWLDRAGQCILQLLPINEMPPGERSPYSALSAMAIDPQFISMRALEDFDAIGGEAALDSESRATLDSARAAPAIDYAAVRPGEAGRAATLVRALPRDEWDRQDAPRGGLSRVLRRAVVVAGRLRPVQSAARASRRAAVDGMAGADP
jgi:hypothetical protein